MSEFPLHTFGRGRKSRSGYTPLHNGELTPVESPASEDMPIAARAAASSRVLNKKGKRRDRDRYEDDPEESVNLLGDEHREEEEEDHERHEVDDSVSRVSTCSSSFLFF